MACSGGFLVCTGLPSLTIFGLGVVIAGAGNRPSAHQRAGGAQRGAHVPAAGPASGAVAHQDHVRDAQRHVAAAKRAGLPAKVLAASCAAIDHDRGGRHRVDPDAAEQPRERCVCVCIVWRARYCVYACVFCMHAYVHVCVPTCAGTFAGGALRTWWLVIASPVLVFVDGGLTAVGVVCRCVTKCQASTRRCQSTRSSTRRRCS